MDHNSVDVRFMSAGALKERALMGLVDEPTRRAAAAAEARAKDERVAPGDDVLDSLVPEVRVQKQAARASKKGFGRTGGRRRPERPSTDLLPDKRIASSTSVDR